MVKNLPANAGDTGNVDLIPGLGRFPGEGNGNGLQYSCLGNPMDEEPVGLQVDTTEQLNRHTCICLHRILLIFKKIIIKQPCFFLILFYF